MQSSGAVAADTGLVGRITLVRQDPRIRFAVGSADGPRSSVWVIWRHTNKTKADVFLATRALAGTLKISFHESGETRDAFTSEYAARTPALQSEASGRIRQQWRREQLGATGISRLYQVCFPHSELRKWPIGSELTATDITWVPQTPQDATFIELLVTRPGLEALQIRNFDAVRAEPLVHWFLPSGENLLVLARAGPLDSKARLHIREAVARVPARQDRATADDVVKRLTLTTEPQAGLATTVEVAFPCAVAESAA